MLGIALALRKARKKRDDSPRAISFFIIKHHAACDNYLVCDTFAL